MDRYRVSFFLLGATLALGLGWSAHLIGSAIVKMRQENLIRVKGTADMAIAADIAKWRCSIVARDPDLKAASTALDGERAEVLRYLADHGFPAAAVEVDHIEISRVLKKSENGEHDTNDLDHYLLSQSFVVDSPQVERVQEVSRSITELVKSGIEVGSGRPDYLFSQLESVKLDLLAKATRNAHERATILADNGGGALAGLASASQGVFQITPVNSTETRDDGNYDTSTIKKTVKCVVTLEFHLAK